MYYDNPPEVDSYTYDELLETVRCIHRLPDVYSLFGSVCADCCHTWGDHSNYEEGCCIEAGCRCPRFAWPDERSSNPEVDGWW